MAEKIKPLGDKVVLKKVEVEEKTKSGIVLPDSAKETPEFSEVVAVGPGTDDVKMEVKKGDKVAFAKYAGTDLKIDGTEYTIISQKDILAIIG